MNRLDTQNSPYLKAHATDLVDWYPWGDEALLHAKNEKKPIFLSIGYYSSLFCYIMQEESFNDKDIALILNKHFVCIKVDKESRGDIDKYFQGVYQLLNRKSGGWPLSILLSHEQKPFYAAQYIPKIKQGNDLDFKELLDVTVKQYAQNHDEIIKNANEIDYYMNKSINLQKVVEFNNDFIPKVEEDLLLNYEKEKNNYLQISKLFSSSFIDLAIHTYHFTHNSKLLQMVVDILDNIILSTAYDNIDGGWYKYQHIDKAGRVYFEKTGCDNALITQTYINAYHLTNKKTYKNIAIDTLEFMLNKMSNKKLFFAGNSIKSDNLKIHKSFNIDHTIITSQNATIIKTMFIASVWNKKYLTQAIKSLDELLNTILIDNILYHSIMTNCVPTIKAFLKDYAYLIDTLLISYRYTLNELHLVLAQKLSLDVMAKFYDRGEWYNSTIGEFKAKEELNDEYCLSSIALMNNNFMTLSSLGEHKFKYFADQSIKFYSSKLDLSPTSYALFCDSILRTIMDDRVIKSSKNNLNNICSLLDGLYPYSFVKISDQKNYELCGNNNSFGLFNNFEQLKERING